MGWRSEFTVHLDLPPGAVLRGSSAVLRGWVAGLRPAGPLEVRFEGVAVPTRWHPRRDVETALPDRPYVVGFEAVVELGRGAGSLFWALVPGAARHRLEVRMDGHALRTWRLRVEAEPAPPPRAQLFVLGAAKCGTTSVADLLAGHPEVCMARPKEPAYFEREIDLGPRFYWGKYFGHYAGEPVIGEAAVRNLVVPEVPARIKAYNPAARFLVLVRHPIERLVSHWRFAQRDGRTVRPLDELIRATLDKPAGDPAWNEQASTGPGPRGQRWSIGLALRIGDYAAGLRRFHAHFPRERFLVLEFDELVTLPAEVVQRVLAFAGVDPGRHPAPRLAWKNEGAPTAHPAEPIWEKVRADLRDRGAPRLHEARHPYFLAPDVLAALRDHYRPRVRELEELLGRPMGWDLG